MSDIASISAAQQAQVQQEAVFAVARKTLDQAEAEGAAALSLLQQAADLAKGAQATAGPQPLAPGQSINVLA